MPKTLTMFAVAAFLAATALAPNMAAAKSDKAAKASTAQAKECLKIADAKKKDECVKQAQKKAKGMSVKADKAAKKGMEKAKGKK